MRLTTNSFKRLASYKIGKVRYFDQLFHTDLQDRRYIDIIVKTKLDIEDMIGGPYTTISLWIPPDVIRNM